jgi:hypothetical protein
MLQVPLPSSVQATIGSEPIDFAVLAQRYQPLKKSISQIQFGILLTGLSSLFLFESVKPILTEIHTLRSTYTTMDPIDLLTNAGSALFFLLIIILFCAAGIGVIVQGIRAIFQNGGYMIGTPTRLIHVRNKYIRSIQWSEFSGDINVTGDMNKGTIRLFFHSGELKNPKYTKERFEHHSIQFTDIPNVHDIENICMQRIRANQIKTT